jgi:hypothetical protein
MVLPVTSGAVIFEYGIKRTVGLDIPAKIFVCNNSDALDRPRCPVEVNREFLGN